MLAIALFFVGHWLLSVFCQTFFLHRYGAHRQFTMSHRWERVFFFATWLTQGASFLSPRGYAILHREHHAFSDTARDPHSPHFQKNPLAMMIHTKNRYNDLVQGRVEPELRFASGYPEWETLDRIGNLWSVRIAFGAAYTLFYAAFAPSVFYSDPRRDRQLVRPQIRLPKFRHPRPLAKHPALRLPDPRRTLPEQPPQGRHVAKLRGALVRDRSGLLRHPHARSTGDRSTSG